MATLKIWHGTNHEDFTVTEITDNVMCRTAEQWITNAIGHSGFWDTVHTFVPWHRVNYIEVLGAKK